jgi:hypothetical protein
MTVTTAIDALTELSKDLRSYPMTEPGGYHGPATPMRATSESYAKQCEQIAEMLQTMSVATQPALPDALKSFLAGLFARQDTAQSFKDLVSQLYTEIYQEEITGEFTT